MERRDRFAGAVGRGDDDRVALLERRLLLFLGGLFGALLRLVATLLRLRARLRCLVVALVLVFFLRARLRHVDGLRERIDDRRSARRIRRREFARRGTDVAAAEFDPLGALRARECVERSVGQLWLPL